MAEREVAEGADESTGDNVFAMVRRIGQAKAELAADYAAQLARSAGKVVFFAKHLDVMDAAQEVFAKRDIRYTTIRGDQTSTARQQAIDSFVNDPDVAVIICSLTAAGVGINLQVASNVVLAELSWTNAEQTQAIDRVHRIGQREPVTAWRIIAAQTIDAKIAELIDSKAGLAARALDGRTRRPPPRPTSRSRPWSRCSPPPCPRAPTTTEPLRGISPRSLPVLGSRPARAPGRRWSSTVPG